MVGATLAWGGGCSQDLRWKHLWVGLEEGTGQLKTLGTGMSPGTVRGVEWGGGSGLGRVRGGNVVNLEEHAWTNQALWNLYWSCLETSLLGM